MERGLPRLPKVSGSGEGEGEGWREAEGGRLGVGCDGALWEAGGGRLRLQGG